MNIQKIVIAAACLFVSTLVGCGDKEKPYTTAEVQGIRKPPPMPKDYKPDTRGGGPPPATN